MQKQTTQVFEKQQNKKQQNVVKQQNVAKQQKHLLGITKAPWASGRALFKNLFEGGRFNKSFLDKFENFIVTLHHIGFGGLNSVKSD